MPMFFKPVCHRFTVSEKCGCIFLMKKKPVFKTRVGKCELNPFGFFQGHGLLGNPPALVMWFFKIEDYPDLIVWDTSIVARLLAAACRGVRSPFG